MSSEYRQQVEEAIDAIRITSLTAYAWFGRRSQPLPLRSRAQLNEDSSAACLTVALQHQLYSDFYTLGRAMPVTNSSKGTGPGATAEFTTELAQANCGTEYWDGGWTVRNLEIGEVASVTKNGLSLQAEFSSLQPRPEKIGQMVAVRFPCEELATSPGYYVATGTQAMPDEGRDLLRLYWNLVASDAIWLMRRLTVALIDKKLGFRFKALRDPNSYTRADAAVLYFSRCDVETVHAVIGSLYPKLPAGPKPLVPALTRALAPGLGFAEHPGGNQSFGLHRCHLLAQALVWAYRRGASSMSERIEIVEGHLLEQGIQLDRPYLNPHSTEPEIIPIFHVRRSPRRPAQVNKIDRDACRARAAEIGSRICREAYWHRGACTWAGVVPDPNDESSMLAATECRTLGPDLYGGTSGIGLFLAQLHAVDPSQQVRRTALGAMRHALLRASATDLSLRFGQYTGSCGIVLASLRVAYLLEDEEVRSESHRLAHRILKSLTFQRPVEPDLLSGKAGAITSLLLMAKEFRRDDALDAALRLGDQLVLDARPRNDAVSWPSARIRRRRDLTGFSHGAAGIALALLELSAALNEKRFASMAERAFAYERQHFDKNAKNWRDFRPPDAHRRRVFASAWCNGAPGIGLSRMRAWELSGNQSHRSEAELALGTTHQSLKDALASADSASCFCHGVAGNADILLEAKQRMNWSNGAQDLIQAAAAGAVPPPATPGLMLGQAGIGYFLLRVSDPATVPTPLLISQAWLQK